MSITIDGIDIPSSCAVCPCIKAWGCGAKYKPIPSDILELSKPDWCPIRDPNKNVEVNVFDIVEEYPNCMVQILKSSVTGQISIGWRPNDS